MNSHLSSCTEAWSTAALQPISCAYFSLFLLKISRFLLQISRFLSTLLIITLFATNAAKRKEKNIQIHKQSRQCNYMKVLKNTVWTATTCDQTYSHTSTCHKYGILSHAWVYSLTSFCTFHTESWKISTDTSHINDKGP